MTTEYQKDDKGDDDMFDVFFISWCKTYVITIDNNTKMRIQKVNQDVARFIFVDDNDVQVPVW